MIQSNINKINFKKSVWYFLLAVNILLILAFWWNGSVADIGGNMYSSLIAFGRLGGLLAVFTVLLQFLLAGRNPWLEKAFGLDKLFRIHHLNGQVSLLFLLLHPVFMIIGYAGLLNLSWWQQYKFFLTNNDLIASSTAVGLFILVVFTSIYIVRKKLKYESWYFVHLVVYVAVFLSLGHQFELGTTLNVSQIFYLYWIVLYVAVFGVHLIFRFLKPIYNYYRHRFRLEKIVRESHNCVSLYIGGQRIDKFDYQAGQFVIVRFLVKGLWWQAHPFSLSKAADGQSLRLTVKELGDFTSKLKNLPEGAKILIEGPYGIFTDFFGLSNKVLLIAGGIGITPIRALAEEMSAKGRQVELLYAVKTQPDVVFMDELEKLRQERNINIRYVFSEEVVTGHLSGYLTKEVLVQTVPDIKEREVFVCGPIPMMESIKQAVFSLGINSKQFHFEKFKL